MVKHVLSCERSGLVSLGRRGAEVALPWHCAVCVAFRDGCAGHTWPLVSAPSSAQELPRARNEGLVHEPGH